MKNYCLYVFIGAPKKFVTQAPKFLKTALQNGGRLIANT